MNSTPNPATLTPSTPPPAPYSKKLRILKEFRAEQALADEALIMNWTGLGDCVERPFLQPKSLKEICRIVFHVTLGRQQPTRTRTEAIYQIRDALAPWDGDQCLTIPDELVTYLLEEREHFWHDFPEGHFEPMGGSVEWIPISHGVRAYTLHRLQEDKQACCTCLRGSKEPNNKLITTLLLRREKPYFNASTLSPIGSERTYLRTTTCSAKCYLDCHVGRFTTLMFASFCPEETRKESLLTPEEELNDVLRAPSYAEMTNNAWREYCDENCPDATSPNKYLLNKIARGLSWPGHTPHPLNLGTSSDIDMDASTEEEEMQQAEVVRELFPNTFDDIEDSDLVLDFAKL